MKEQLAELLKLLAESDPDELSYMFAYHNGNKLVRVASRLESPEVAIALLASMTCHIVGLTPVQNLQKSQHDDES